MSQPLGFNPIYWSCDKQGCFNVFCRPKIEEFAECFGGRIAMGDLDGVVERRGHILLFEWKHLKEHIPLGQWLQLRNHAKKPGVTVILAKGDTATMETAAYRRIWMEPGKPGQPSRLRYHPKAGGWEPTTTAGLKAVLTAWYRYADKHPLDEDVLDEPPDDPTIRQKETKPPKKTEKKLADLTERETLDVVCPR